MHSLTHSLRRIWQPQRGLFWLMLAVNGLSALLVFYIQVARPAGALLWALSLLALVDTLLGWWLLRRLWIETGPEAVASGS